MGRRRRELALILMLLYSSMVASLAYKPQLFTTDNGRHQESEHMGKHGTRYNISTIIPHEGRHGDANVIPIHIALAGGGGGRGGGGGVRGGGGGGGNSSTGNRHQNYMRFIVGGVSISIAYLCALI